MRRLLLFAAFLASCGGLPPPEDACEAAQYEFLACGVRVPLLSDGACVGVRLSAAECVQDHAGTCEDLLELARAPDTCLTELLERPFDDAPGDDLFPGNDPQEKR